MTVAAGVRTLSRALSERPERAWPWGVVHHGARLLLVLLLAIGVHMLFPVSPLPDIPVLEKGMVPDKDIIAEVPFPIYKTQEELSRDRAEAAASVTPIFDYTPGAVDTMLARVDGFMAQADSAAAATGGAAAQQTRLQQLAAAYGLPTTPEVVDLLHSSQSRGILSRALDATIKAELPVGIAAASELSEGSAPQVRVRRKGREQSVLRDSVLTAPRLFERAARHLPWNAPQGTAELERLLLIRFFEPSLHLNRDATDQAREQARQAVPMMKGQVIRGEKVVGAHEQVRDEDMQRLKAYRDQLTRLGRAEGGGAGLLRTIGAVTTDLMLLLVLGVLLYFYRPHVYTNFRHVVLLALLVAGTVAAAAVVDRLGAPPEVIPVALPALVVAALWDGRLALTLALLLAVLLGIQAPFLGISAIFLMVEGGAAAALAVRVVHRRSQTWVFVALIAAAYVASAVALGLLRSSPAAEILDMSLYGIGNAVASALVAMGLLPLLEVFTHITTDQTLLELADMNRPLLKRLALEAPGTYAHSINVANLAEAGARAIDANALLTRIGTYYHDIGKMAKPQYYIENQPQGRNPHDRLKPTTSAAIVRGHVLEGVRLAEQYKLPDSVKAFIREHHGTQTIGFFLEQAREMNPDGELNVNEFAYPGPRPQSRETALVMLADSVESAAHVLQDPTPDRIRALVDRIVDGKIALGQLDESPLTLAEVAQVKEQFAKVLTGMYHHRIDYPTVPNLGEPVGPPAAKGAAD